MTKSPRQLRIAVLPGDGVGREVIPAGMRVLEQAAGDDNTFQLAWTEFPWGSEFYIATGRMMPENALAILRDFDAIYLGAVGAPSVPDHITLWGMLLPIRQRFDLYVNLRPVKLFPGVPCPLANVGPDDVDMIVVRENSEGEYSGVGGRVHVGFGHEVAVQTDVFTRSGVEQLVRFAFDLARTRKQHLTSITKSNASPYAFVFWDEVVMEVGREYSDVAVERMLVDAAAARFITHPQTFDVVVASNLFGDILTDIGAVIQGSMGLAASANINPLGKYPGMFEPVHGSAPDIAGQGVANPLGAIWAGALMLDHLGKKQTSERILTAMQRVLAGREVMPPDLGGEASTTEVTEAVVNEVRNPALERPA